MKKYITLLVLAASILAANAFGEDFYVKNNNDNLIGFNYYLCYNDQPGNPQTHICRMIGSSGYVDPHKTFDINTPGMSQDDDVQIVFVDSLKDKNIHTLTNYPYTKTEDGTSFGIVSVCHGTPGNPIVLTNNDATKQMDCQVSS